MTEKILVLTTGGTIDKQYFDALSEFTIVDTIVDQLLKIARVAHPFDIEQVMRKDSLELDERDRLSLAGHVARSSAQRVVITHGTDTMTETAKTLAQLDSGKTIVLTGALAPARFSESDAAFNLGMAFAAVQTLAPGIYITMSGTVFDALHVRKDRAAGAFMPVSANSSA